MSEKKTNGEKIGILKTMQNTLAGVLSFKKIGNFFERIRNWLADLSKIILWIGNYIAFGIVIFLVIGSIWGIGNATLELFKVLSDSPKDIDSLYPKLIKIAEYYLISFTLFLIAIGIHRIISKVISKDITKIEHLESLMIGLVVITMSVIFLDTIFGVAMEITKKGVESVLVERVLMFGLAMAVVIVGLALYLKFREKRAESEVPIDEVIDKAFTEKEKEEMYKKLKEELKKAIEERRKDDVEKIVSFTKEEREEIYKKLKEELKKAIEEKRENDVEKIVRLIDSIKKLEERREDDVEKIVRLIDSIKKN